MEHRQYYKMSFYEGSVRVPLVISGGDFGRNVTNRRLTTLLDIYPTLLDIARIDSKTQLDGQSLCQGNDVVDLSRSVVSGTVFQKNSISIIEIIY